MLRLVILLVFSSSAVISEPIAERQRESRFWSGNVTGKPPPALSRPRVTPETFVDDGRQFAVFTCHSEGHQLDLLSWFQRQGENNSRLVMRQFPRGTSTTVMSLVLNKTLTSSDNDSSIFCVRWKHVGAFPTLSHYIHFTFSRNVSNENLYITVQPASEVATFYVNTTRSFECGGSRPVDGRSFNWYIENDPSSNNFSHAPAEKMVSNPNTRSVNLTLDLNESYHLKKIYCVQEYHKTLESSHGYYYWNYGENARSNKILLSMVSEDHLTDSGNTKDERPTTTPATVQTTTIALTSNESVKNVVITSSCVVIVVLVLVIIGIYRRFRKQVNLNEMPENIMSRPPMELPPEVEYAEVYSHGAGLWRPQRQQAPGPPRHNSDLEQFLNV